MVIGVHADLVVTGKCIHKIEKFVARGGVHDEVDPWQREAVLRACFIYVSEVDTESPLAVCFFDEYNISQLLRIFHLSDCSCLEELADLLVDGFLSFWCEAPALLLNRFEEWVGVKLMSDYCRVNSSHVCLLPCENISIPFQKLSEEAFEVFR